MRSIQKWSIPLVLGASLVAGACSDSTSPPPPGIVSGSVTTVDGTPVEGASILVGYRPSLVDLLGPRNGPGLNPLTINPDNILRVWVTDTCGEEIRTVCEKPCSSSVFWNGRDDGGLRVLDGFYTLWIETRPDSLSQTETLSDDIFIFTEYPAWDPGIYRDPHATTAADGTFEFDDRCLGFGKSLAVSSDTLDTEYPITRWIDLLAVHPDGRRMWEDSLYVPAGETASVDFVFDVVP